MWNCVLNSVVCVQIKLFVGLYHGSEALCAVQETDELSVQDGCCNVKVDLTLPAVVADIPRSARLCFSVCAATTSKKKNARVCLNCSHSLPFGFLVDLHGKSNESVRLRSTHLAGCDKNFYCLFLFFVETIILRSSIELCIFMPVSVTLALLFSFTALWFSQGQRGAGKARMQVIFSWPYPITKAKGFES